MKKIKVFIVDDSAVVRQVMTQILSKAPDIEVLGSAPDPILALQKMQQNWPDVVTLDIEMPRMDGVTFLKKLMSEHPTPVVICSSLAVQGAETTMQALEAGAASIITKPTLNVHDFLHDASNDVLAAVRGAAASNLSNLRSATSFKPIPKNVLSAVPPMAAMA